MALFRLISVLVTLALFPGRGEAQTQFEPMWDIAGMAGLFAGHTPDPDAPGYRDDWFHVVQGGGIVGRHLTRHLKIEVEATGTNGGTQFMERLVTVPGQLYPYSVGVEATTSVWSVGAAATWQLRENEWVHPFVQAGVSADFDRVTTRTWEPFNFNIPPGRPSVPIVEETTHRRARAVLGGGAKVYVSERAFVRTDGRFTFDRDHQNIVLRVGLGIDLN